MIYHCLPIRLAKIKIVSMPNADEAEKLYLSSPAGGNVK